MQALEAAQARDQLRITPPEAIVVRTLDDIKRVVAEYDPQHNKPQPEITIKAVVPVVQNDQTANYELSAPSQSKSKRDIVIEGLNIAKSRIDVSKLLDVQNEGVEINGQTMKPASLSTGLKGIMWVDNFIKQWFGGYRDGTNICWDLNDGFTYRYDIYKHSLNRSQRTPAGA